MTLHSDAINAVQEELLNTRENVFGHDLCGFASSAAAAELVHHWRQCQPPLTLAERRGDLADVIAALQQWSTDLV